MSTSSSSSPGDDTRTLPLASFVAARASTHPLPRLVTDPVLPRLAAVEAALLTSRPATLLLRLGLASERSIVAVALVAIIGALARWRAQWRAIVWALGVGEALSRTVRLLRRQVGVSDAAGAKGKERGQAHEPTDADGIEDETAHVLSFWLLFAALSLFDTLRSTPAAATTSASVLSFLAIPERLRATLRAAHSTCLHFFRLYLLPSLLRLRWSGRALTKRYPALDPAPRFAYFTAFPYAFPRLYSTPPRRTSSFPRPRSRPWDPTPTSLPLSWSYFAYPSSSSSSTAPAFSPRAAAAAEARWEVVKLVLLWTGVRHDGWGAKSVVWDWLLAPLLGALPSGPDDGTVLRIVREPRVVKKAHALPMRASLDSQRPQTSQDDHEVRSVSPSPSIAASVTPHRGPASEAAAHPSPSPYTLAWTPPRTAHLARSPSLSSSRTASPAPAPRPPPFALQDPPTPKYGTPAGVSYRFASANHPLLAARAGAGGELERGGAKTRGKGRGRKRDSLLFESPPRSPAMREYGERDSDGSDEEEEGEGLTEDEEDDDVPPTPGEEEAEEGARRWATVFADAHAAMRPLGGDEVEEVVPVEGHASDRAWSA